MERGAATGAAAEAVSSIPGEDRTQDDEMETQDRCDGGENSNYDERWEKWMQVMSKSAR